MAPRQWLDEMARSLLIRRLTGPSATILLSVTLLIALFLLTEAVQPGTALSNNYSVLVAVNVIGITLLMVLIVWNLWRLIRNFRRQRLGSRLTMRLLGAFALLSILPLAIVYYFSVQFLSNGIDSWYDVKIERALDDAHMLGQTSLEAVKRDAVEQVKEESGRIADALSSHEIFNSLDELRDSGDYSEATLFADNGRILGSSNTAATTLVPDTPDDLILSNLRNDPGQESIFSQLRSGQEYVSLEPGADGSLQIRVVVPVFSRKVSEQNRALQVLKPLPDRYTKLDQSVQTAFNEYQKLVYLRGPLKFSFVLTLTLISLMSTLLTLWVAIFMARRLMAPLGDLAEGTQAVATGDYHKQLPVTSSDEFGVLVQSFNDMTRKISQAQNQARRSQRETEVQRTWLETILSHLSSSVLVIDRNQCLLDVNAATKQILGVDLELEEGKAIAQLPVDHPELRPLVSAIENGIGTELPEWQAEVNITGQRGHQVLNCRGTRLSTSSQSGSPGGYVVVLDEVTDLIQAQRDAAWFEVARRLAHEIKNPLTPIQLSAERIRRKYLDGLEGDERTTLDRATRTIGQQVESMKEMVNAFSKYAQPMRMETEEFHIDELIKDVVELYRDDQNSTRFRLQLDTKVPIIAADPDRIRQVLNNLIINARDALEDRDDGLITIVTHYKSAGEQSRIEIQVNDNGPGLDETLLDRLFEPYVTTKTRGTGLGLAIVKRIIEEHGGTIWATNQADGGASVTIRLNRQVIVADNDRDVINEIVGFETQVERAS